MMLMCLLTVFISISKELCRRDITEGPTYEFHRLGTQNITQLFFEVMFFPLIHKNYSLIFSRRIP